MTDEPLVALKSRPEQNSLDDGYMMDGWMVDERLYVAIWWMVDGGYMVVDGGYMVEDGRWVAVVMKDDTLGSTWASPSLGRRAGKCCH